MFNDKLCIVTGASTGIGAELARQLAARKARLVLVARSKDRLEALAQTLDTETKVVALDLSSPTAASELKRAVPHTDVLINNAGFATYGRFAEVSLERQQQEVALNVQAVVALTHAYLPELERAGGAVMHVASTAAFQPVPYMAVYAATKAFVLSFSEALWAEYRERGVRVTALCPGATETPFFDVVGAEEASFGTRMSAAEVARIGLEALEAGKSHVIPGFMNRLTALAPRFAPRATTAKVTGRLMQPRAAAPVLAGGAR
jgi:short-subunit dehydrogenase